ncbi:DEAD/DEAH box helicase [Paraglaciecola arctica]|uniref:UvrD-like helicase C-terminal domain-containing protein n=1 Tax=Paraglaciecola arctica BSs20135 TaxID=493475 RepID=K6ZA09_9ALTE|nr:ATP-binding domain-containing protein [Paraglaciecola arctica]GAC20280.1 hypothetical protein GARC_3322 [Paraglaciecola arctica BSs20135]
MVTIVQGATKKPVSAQRLVTLFSELNELEGFLYIGYPVIGTAEGPYPIDAIFVSKQTGLIVFNLVEGVELGEFRETQDDSVNKLESKLRSHKSLMQGRQLKVTITPVTFAPAKENPQEFTSDDYQVCNEENMRAFILSLKWETPEYFKSLLAIVQAISTIRKGRKKRVPLKPDSRGAKLQMLEDSIANLDNLQGRAVIETVQGVQRIRGLAGSGKTIVLALKAAYLHAQHPDWKIAVSFHTRSLKGQFKKLINTFVIEQTNEEPDWENLEILHSWGSPGGGYNNGIYYSFCKHNEIEYLDFKAAKSRFASNKEFEGVCKKALDEVNYAKQIYDVVLIDEAQDFPPAFLKMCYDLLKPEKRLVYAYDELQNLSSQSLPSPEEIFGLDTQSKPLVTFEASQPGQPQQDVILEKCYRNSRPLLVTAHALGFGVYRQPPPNITTGLVQMFDHEELWKEVGYEVSEGQLAAGKRVVLRRTENSSPKFLEDHSPIEDLIEFNIFNTLEEQAQWLADSIQQNLAVDELRPDDIVVINPDPLTTRKAVGPARKILFERNINTHLAGVDTSPDVFFDSDSDSVAFTGIYRAKGNEAGMVYIINAQDCYSSFGSMAKVRNQLFTAITRSKAWVRVLGVGPMMAALKEEFEMTKNNQFQLDFTYPTEEQRQHLNIVNRDMTAAEKNAVRKKQENLTQLLSDLESGAVFAEDLGVEQLERLRNLLSKKEV